MSHLPAFQFSYLMAVSPLILLVFLCFDKAQFRVAWLLSLSVPGALLLPFLLITLLMDRWVDANLTFLSYLRDVEDLLTVIPLAWIAPIVFCKQLWNLARGHFLPTDRWSWVASAALVALDLWTVAVT